MKTILQAEYTEHPMERLLDLEPCTTLTEYKEVVPDVPVEHVAYDEKDTEIETKIEEVYSLAIDAATVLSDEIESVEGKYKARMGEVSATMLNVALSAVREKRQLKEHKDKLTGATRGGAGGKTVNNNLIVADRNELLRMMLDKK
jgi:hypothetical protein